MSIEGQGHFFTIYFPGFVCFVLYKAKISGERLQDHWSSGLISGTWTMYNVHTYFFMVSFQDMGLNLGSLHAGETLLTVFSYHAQLGDIAVIKGKILKTYGALHLLDRKRSIQNIFFLAFITLLIFILFRSVPKHKIIDLNQDFGTKMLITCK